MKTVVHRTICHMMVDLWLDLMQLIAESCRRSCRSRQSAWCVPARGADSRWSCLDRSQRSRPSCRRRSHQKEPRNRSCCCRLRYSLHLMMGLPMSMRVQPSSGTTKVRFRSCRRQMALLVVVHHQLAVERQRSIPLGSGSSIPLGLGLSILLDWVLSRSGLVVLPLNSPGLEPSSRPEREQPTVVGRPWVPRACLNPVGRRHLGCCRSCCEWRRPLCSRPEIRRHNLFRQLDPSRSSMAPLRRCRWTTRWNRKSRRLFRSSFVGLVPRPCIRRRRPLIFPLAPRKIVGRCCHIRRLLDRCSRSRRCLRSWMIPSCHNWRTLSPRCRNHPRSHRCSRRHSRRCPSRRSWSRRCSLSRSQSQRTRRDHGRPLGCPGVREFSTGCRCASRGR